MSHRVTVRSNQENRTIAERSAKAAADSADSARSSAEDAAKVAKIEADREHRALGPAATVVSFEGDRDSRIDGWNVFAVVATERCYRVRGEAVLDSGAVAPLGLPLVLHAHTPTRVHVERMPPDRDRPVAKRVVLRMWPPNADLDDVEPWTCPCGKPVEDGDGTVGHWQIERPLNYRRPGKTRVRFLS
jgi:hypothetical protein